MKKTIITFIVILTISICGYANETAENFQKIDIARVVDGDTVSARFANNTASIRLIGIDCYETSPIYRAYKQAYDNKITIEKVTEQGKTAKKILEGIIKENKDNIYLRCEGIDKYGRILGVLYTDKININDTMRATGYCPTYIYNSK